MSRKPNWKFYEIVERTGGRGKLHYVRDDGDISLFTLEAAPCETSRFVEVSRRKYRYYKKQLRNPKVLDIGRFARRFPDLAERPSGRRRGIINVEEFLCRYEKDLRGLELEIVAYKNDIAVCNIKSVGGRAPYNGISVAVPDRFLGCFDDGTDIRSTASAKNLLNTYNRLSQP